MRRRALLNGDKKDYSQDYFTMVVTVGGDIKWSGSTVDNSLQYSKDNGTTWTTANSATTISVTAGDKVLWKGTPTPSSKGIGKFSGATDVRYSIEGNAMSLLFGDNFKGQTSLTGKDYAFYELFYNCDTLTSAENVSLPATTLANYCYQNMFYQCQNLTTAPELPATTLANYCYTYMFYGCSSLTAAPLLPATTLAERCYQSMFSNCSSLTTAPELPATTLASQCYFNMFYNCTSLTTAPELPATTLADFCYGGMFYNCTSLTTASELPATTLAEKCYGGMFYGCSGLTTAPVLPATTLASQCYYRMFYGCSSLTTAPELPATTLAESCYRQMFKGCTSLSAITCLATDISASNCTYGWVSNVAASGTFTKASSMTSWTSGNSGIPSGWTIRNPVVLYPEDYDTPVSGYISSKGRWTNATSSGRQTWVFHDITNYQGGKCNLYLGRVTGYYAFVKEIPTAAGSVQYASGWSNRATLSQDAIGIQIPSDAVYLCFYYHGSTGNMYPSKVEIYPQE